MEGCDLDGTPNNDTMNEWNDLRLILEVSSNNIPIISHTRKATTEPGSKYTVNPLNPEGEGHVEFMKLAKSDPRYLAIEEGRRQRAEGRRFNIFGDSTPYLIEATKFSIWWGS